MKNMPNIDITHRDFMIAEVVEIEEQIEETKKLILGLEGQLKEAIKIKEFIQLERHRQKEQQNQIDNL